MCFFRNTFVVGKTLKTFRFLAQSASLLTPETADDIHGRFNLYFRGRGL